MRVCPRCRLIYVNPAFDECGVHRETLVERSVDPLLASTVDRFEILELLGAGAMGRVYRGRHQTLDRPVAIKILYGDFACDDRFRTRFEREAQAVGKMHHPNIVGVTDFGSVDGLYFLVMEHTAGRALDEVIDASAPFSPERVKSIAMQIADGLSEAHSHGFVHRDLKPANILIDEEAGDRVRILDFGVVSMIYTPTEGQRLTNDGQVIGTPMYMSPEQTLDPDVTPSSDLYSLGVVMYEMLSGRPPFLYEGRMAMMLAHVQEVPPPLPSSSGLEDLILRLLGKQPDDRPPSAQAVRTELDRLQLIDGLPVERGVAHDPSEGPATAADSDPNLRTFDTFPSLRAAGLIADDWSFSVPPPVVTDPSVTAPSLGSQPSETLVVAKPPPASTMPAAKPVKTQRNWSPARQAAADRMKVLIIDGDADQAGRLRQALEESFDVRITPDLAAGLRAVESVAYRAILLNLTLPDCDGLETLEKAMPHTQGTPVVVVSHLEMDWLAVESIKRGAQDYVVLSSSGLEQLPSRVRFAIHRDERGPHPRPAAEKPASSPRTPVVPQRSEPPTPKPRRSPWPLLFAGALLAALGVVAGRMSSKGDRVRTEPITMQRPSNPVTEAPPPPQVAEPSVSSKMLTVISQPSGARVVIDGEVVGKTPLIQHFDVEAATIEIELRAEGFQSWRKSVPQNEDGNFVVNADLEALSGTATTGY